jgi:hypothetical protein
VEIPTREAVRQIGGFIQNAITLVRSWEGQTGGGDAIPRKAIVLEKTLRAFDPAGHDSGRAVL